MPCLNIQIPTVLWLGGSGDWDIVPTLAVFLFEPFLDLTNNYSVKLKLLIQYANNHPTLAQKIA